MPLGYLLPNITCKHRGRKKLMGFRVWFCSRYKLKTPLIFILITRTLTCTNISSLLVLMVAANFRFLVQLIWFVHPTISSVFTSPIRRERYVRYIYIYKYNSTINKNKNHLKVETNMRKHQKHFRVPWKILWCFQDFGIFLIMISDLVKHRSKGFYRI